MLLLGALLFTQLNVAAVLAVDNNPITSAITSAINDITNQNPTSTLTPSPTPQPSSNPAPVTTPVVNPTPTPTPTPTPEPPMTAPIPNPTPTPAPVTSPVTNPTPQPGSTPVATAPITNPTPQPTPSATPTPANPGITLTPSNSKVKVATDSGNLNISIPSNVSEPKLDLTDLKITSPTAVSVILSSIVNIVKTTNLGDIQVQLPQGIMISGPALWDGNLNMPTILLSSTVTPPAEAGKINTVTGVIEIGANDTFLTLDKAIRILIPGQANKLVGYKSGTNFSKIAQICNSDSQTVGDNLEGAGNCYINVGLSLVVWTKHFTKYVTYTESAQTSSSSNSNSVLAPIDPKYGSQAPICGDSKPTSTPRIISAASVEPNTVVINWSGANDPVSYYLIAYGTKSGKMEYGNPNVGDKTTRSYKIKNLSGGQTYFFKVRAGNNCMPGEFSNEVKVLVSGAKLNTKEADGFKAGVLSTKTSSSSSEINLPFKSITYANPARFITESTNFITKIFRLFTHLFKS